MFEFIEKLFGNKPASKSIAKERLRLVLIQDRSAMSPAMLDALKVDLIKVISEYMSIDIDALEVCLENENDSIALVCNIPILEMKRTKADN
ncbi:MAG: cell division topological specificity factor MinE [Clostridia bacterium]|jgi:cell division topological specificity factor